MNLEKMREIAAERTIKVTFKPYNNANSRFIDMCDDNIDLLLDVAEAAMRLEEFSPTPDSYVGGQSAYSMTRHRLATDLKTKLEALERVRELSGNTG